MEHVIFSDEGTVVEDLDGDLQFGLAPALDELDLHCPLIDLFQKPVTKRIMNFECSANDIGGGLPMNHLPHPCFIRVHRWLKLSRGWEIAAASADPTTKIIRYLQMSSRRGRIRRGQSEESRW